MHCTLDYDLFLEHIYCLSSIFNLIHTTQQHVEEFEKGKGGRGRRGNVNVLTTYSIMLHCTLSFKLTREYSSLQLMNGMTKLQS